MSDLTEEKRLMKAAYADLFRQFTKARKDNERKARRIDHLELLLAKVHQTVGRELGLKSVLIEKPKRSEA